MQKPMTKTQLVAALAEEMGTDKKTAGAALDAIAALVTREVAAGGAVGPCARLRAGPGRTTVGVVRWP